MAVPLSMVVCMKQPFDCCLDLQIQSALRIFLDVCASMPVDTRKGKFLMCFLWFYIKD